MNPEFEQCLKRNKIREFPRGKALLTKTLGIAQRGTWKGPRKLLMIKITKKQDKKSPLFFSLLLFILFLWGDAQLSDVFG